METPVETRHDWIIAPDILLLDKVVRTVKDNIITLRYEHMCRMRAGGPHGLVFEIADVGSERYARWLEEDTEERKHLPHIQFGGCVVPNQGATKDQWNAYAATLT